MSHELHRWTNGQGTEATNYTGGLNGDDTDFGFGNSNFEFVPETESRTGP